MEWLAAAGGWYRDAGSKGCSTRSMPHAGSSAIEYLGLDAQLGESQLCMLTEPGEILERSIRTQPDRLAELLGERARARLLTEALTESEACMEVSATSSRLGLVDSHRRDAAMLGVDELPDAMTQPVQGEATPGAPRLREICHLAGPSP